MKARQKAEFHPITIILETRVEAIALWDILDDVAKKPQQSDRKKLAIELSEWFSNEAQL